MSNVIMFECNGIELDELFLEETSVDEILRDRVDLMDLADLRCRIRLLLETLESCQDDPDISISGPEEWMLQDELDYLLNYERNCLGTGGL